MCVGAVVCVLIKMVSIKLLAIFSSALWRMVFLRNGFSFYVSFKCKILCVAVNKTDDVSLRQKITLFFRGGKTT